MRIHAKYPVLIEEATVPGYRVPRPVIQVLDTIVNISEHDADAAPVALKAQIKIERRQCKLTEYRYRDEKFYRRHRWGNAEKLSSMLSQKFVRDDEIGRLLESQAERAKARGIARRTAPEGIIDAITKNRESSLWNFDDFYDKRRDGIIVPNSAEATIVAAGEAFQKACERYVLIEGELWIDCPEPVLSVDVHHRPGRMKCLSANMVPDVELVRRTERPSLDEVLFPIASYDEARKLSTKSYDPSMPWSNRDFTLEVLMPEVFSTELPLADALSQLEHCSTMARMPEAIRLRLTDFLTDKENWADDLVHDEIDYVLSQLPDQQRWMVKALEHQQQRFEAKAVHIPIGCLPRL
jgi:hypothetical protein